MSDLAYYLGRFSRALSCLDRAQLTSHAESIRALTDDHDALLAVDQICSLVLEREKINRDIPRHHYHDRNVAYSRNSKSINHWRKRLGI